MYFPPISMTLQAASGDLTAAFTSTPKMLSGAHTEALIVLKATTLTLADADDEVDFYIQTTYDGATTWNDLANVHFANADDGSTPTKLIRILGHGQAFTNKALTDGTLADNTVSNLPLGDQLRIKCAVTGATAPTYAFNATALVRNSAAGSDPATASGGVLTDALIADDAAFTPATTKVLMAGFEYDDATPDAVNEGDGGAVRMSANRNLYAQIRDAAGNERGANVDASNRLAVIPPAVYAEDLVHTSGQDGLFVLGIRSDDDDASLVGASGDYSGLTTNALGSLRVTLQTATLATYKQTATTGVAVVIASGSAGTRHYLTALRIQNEAAVASLVSYQNGSAVMGKIQLTTSQGSGLDRTYSVPARLDAATAFTVTMDTVTTVGVSVDYFTIAE